MQTGLLQGVVRRALHSPYRICAFAAVHFILVVLGAIGIAVEGAPAGPLSPILALYADVAGLDGSYRFFSPDVGDQTIAYVDTASRSRRARRAVVGDGAGEADLRFAKFMEFMAGMDKRALLARVIAVRAFSRDPDATRATVVIGSYHVPTMREFRAGKRPSIEREFSGEFHQRSRELR
jgi:hypothetical protein